MIPGIISRKPPTISTGSPSRIPVRITNTATIPANSAPIALLIRFRFRSGHLLSYLQNDCSILSDQPGNLFIVLCINRRHIPCGHPCRKKRPKGPCCFQRLVVFLVTKDSQLVVVLAAFSTGSQGFFMSSATLLPPFMRSSSDQMVESGVFPRPPTPLHNPMPALASAPAALLPW